MIKLREWNALSGQLNENQVVGHIKGILFTFRGTTSAGTGSIVDVPEIKIDWAKRASAVTISMQRLAQISALKGGRIGDRANAAGAFFFQAYYPCSIWGDDNAYYLTKKDDFNITVRFNLVTATYTAATMAVHLDVGEGLQKYFVNLTQLTQGGLPISSSSIPITYPRENIVAIYLTPSTNINSLKIRNGQYYFDATFEEWRNITFYRNSVEDNAQETTSGGTLTLNKPDMAELWLAGHGSYSETLDDDATITFDTAGTAPTPDLVLLSLDFTPDKLDESAVVVKSKLNSRIASKQIVGHTRPIQVVQKLSNPLAV